MVAITFRRVTSDDVTVIDASAGQSLMEAAKATGVEGIEAICGGSMACGTCHVYVDPAWFDRLPPAQPAELEMIECGLDPRPISRLACQIRLSAELDGLIVTTPEAQL